MARTVTPLLGKRALGTILVGAVPPDPRVRRSWGFHRSTRSIGHKDMTQLWNPHTAALGASKNAPADDFLGQYRRSSSSSWSLAFFARTWPPSSMILRSLYSVAIARRMTSVGVMS